MEETDPFKLPSAGSHSDATSNHSSGKSDHEQKQEQEQEQEQEHEDTGNHTFGGNTNGSSSSSSSSHGEEAQDQEEQDDPKLEGGVPETIEIRHDPTLDQTRSSQAQAATTHDSNGSSNSNGNDNPEVPIPPLMLEKIVACRLGSSNDGDHAGAVEGSSQVHAGNSYTTCTGTGTSTNTVTEQGTKAGQLRKVHESNCGKKEEAAISQGKIVPIQEATLRLEAARDMQKHTQTDTESDTGTDMTLPGAYAVATTPTHTSTATTNANTRIHTGIHSQGDSTSPELASQTDTSCALQAQYDPPPNGPAPEGQATTTDNCRHSSLSHPRDSQASSSTTTAGVITTTDDSLQASSSSNQLATATAFQINEADLEDEIRNRILSEAVEADVVTLVQDDKTHLEGQAASDDSKKSNNNTMAASSKWCLALLALIVALAIAILIAVVASMQKNKNDNGQNQVRDKNALAFNPNRSTLEIIRERGAVRCGISGDIPGFSHPNPDTGIMQGLNVDHCRAMSMAVFGTPDNIELERMKPKDRFVKLANGTVDVLTITTTHTMARDVFEATSQTGHTFSAPFFYSGLIFAGLHEFVECADNLDSVFGICRSLQICVITGTTHEAILQDLVPGGIVIAAGSLGDMIDKFAAGECHVMASEPPNLPFSRIQESGYDGPFTHGHKMFSREPLTLVTRKHDAEWSNLVNTIVNVMYLAESHGITHSNAAELYQLLLPVNPTAADKELASMMESVVAEIGNYADVYHRHVEHIIPRRGLNLLYHHHDEHETLSPLSSANGLLFSFPLGKVDTKGYLQGPTLQRILSRGFLRCGVAPSLIEDVFPSLRDLNIEFCRALSAALFVGDTDAVEIVELEGVVSSEQCTSTTGTGTSDDDGASVDIVAGVRMTIQLDYQGCSFSPAYFYDDASGIKSAIALMTGDNDTEWSDFVFWIVMSLISAEEQGIEARSIDEMKVVNLYGEQLKQSLRDCVLSVGTYGDIFNRTMLSAGVHREGGNLLNTGPGFGPQQYPVPFQ